jgi:hypothetical protein
MDQGQEEKETVIVVKFKVPKEDLRALNGGKKKPLTREEFASMAHALVNREIASRRKEAAE